MKSIIEDTLIFASTFAVAHYVLFSPFGRWRRNYKLHRRGCQLEYLNSAKPSAGTGQSSEMS